MEKSILDLGQTCVVSLFISVLPSPASDPCTPFYSLRFWRMVALCGREGPKAEQSILVNCVAFRWCVRARSTVTAEEAPGNEEWAPRPSVKKWSIVACLLCIWVVIYRVCANSFIIDTIDSSLLSMFLMSVKNEEKF